MPGDRQLSVFGFAGSSFSATAGLTDVGDNDLAFISSYTGTTGRNTIFAAVKAGYNGGRWNGATGITSSAAAADPTHTHALAVVVNDTTANLSNTSSGVALFTNFDGYNSSPFAASNSLRSTAVLVKYTYFGDADLSGTVDGADYVRIDAGYAADAAYVAANPTGTAFPAVGWYNGDFNYDGIVDGSDYTLIDNAFNFQGASLSSSVIAVSTAELATVGTTAAVPEPAAVGLLAVGVAGLLARRRRD